MHQVIELTPEQTAELSAIWRGQKDLLSPDDYIFIKVKLGRTQAKMTRTQIYRLTMNLAKSGYEAIPEWLIALTDPQ